MRDIKNESQKVGEAEKVKTQNKPDGKILQETSGRTV